MTATRAKMVVVGIEPLSTSAAPGGASEKIRFKAVSGTAPYGPNGESEDNSYARFTPEGAASLTIKNPELLGQYKVGQKFYLDFTPAEETEEEKLVGDEARSNALAADSRRDASEQRREDAAAASAIPVLEQRVGESDAAFAARRGSAVTEEQKRDAAGRKDAGTPTFDEQKKGVDIGAPANAEQQRDADSRKDAGTPTFDTQKADAQAKAPRSRAGISAQRPTESDADFAARRRASSEK